jgi:hypothetical protein
MRYLVAVLMLVGSALALSGCRDDSEVRADLARLQQQVAALQDENTRLNEELARTAAEKAEPADLTELMRRMDRADERLLEAERKLAAQAEKKDPAPDTEAVVEERDPATEDAYAKFKAMQERYDEEQEAERQARRIDRQAERREQMQEFARRAKEAGLDFDPENPRQSGMQIWLDPAKREKAVKVAVDMFQDRRLDPLKLDDQQKSEVLRIEAATRKKVKEITAAGRESGASPEEIAKQVDTARNDTEAELQRTMTEQQYEEYKKSAAEGALLPGTVEELGGMIPPGMIPGFGGPGGQGR